MKQIASLMLGALLLGLAGGASYSQVQITSRVRVKPHGPTVQDVSLVAIGLFAKSMPPPPDMQRSGQVDGWTVQVLSDTDRVKITFHKAIPQAKLQQGNFFTFLCSSAPAQELQDMLILKPPQIALVARRQLFVTYYDYRESYPGAALLATPTLCAVCHGAGHVPCSDCGGTGTIVCRSCGGNTGSTNIMTGEVRYCGQCGGTGKERCASCLGTGEVICPNCCGNGKATADEIGNDLRGKDLFGNLLVLKHSITLPGAILSSNAESVNGHTCQWSYNLGDLGKSREMRAFSRYVDYPMMGLLVLVLMAVGGAGWWVVRRATGPPEPPTPPAWAGTDVANWEKKEEAPPKEPEQLTW